MPERTLFGVLLLTTVSYSVPCKAEATDNSELQVYDNLIQRSDRNHWAFQPLSRPELPPVKRASWVRTPIDQFVLARLESRGWSPAIPADTPSLLRRIYLDLIGLPPTLQEQRSFLANPSPESVDKVIASLLNRPGYGERWGRHWLDLVRFAETNGYERDGTKPSAWRYRDYVIRAFNEDKPFDRFVMEQLAGDELADTDRETMIATTFYRLGPWDDEPADPQQDRFDQLDDMVRTTSQVFLGLTMGCARCHNHKFEAISMHDYYRMVAIFNTLKRPQSGRTELDVPVGTRQERETLQWRNQIIQKIELQKQQLIQNRLTTWMKQQPDPSDPNLLTALRTQTGKRTAEQKRLVTKYAQSALSGKDKKRLSEWDSAIEALRKATEDLPLAYVMQELSPTPPKTHLLMRGRASTPGPVVQAGFPAVLVSRQPTLTVDTDRTSQQRKTLADWIASSSNPLTARVMVNRVWQYHFGDGLVRTPSDFGRAGQPPTHPHLLNWLAHWFVHDANWSLKKLHTLIMASNTYRMSKTGNPEYRVDDVENRLLWRFPYRRLDAETLRDSMLAISGKLNRKMYGPSMYPFIPKDAMSGHSDPDKIWKAFDEKEASRRTIYSFVKRSLIVPLLEVLDFCDTTQSTEQRLVTSVTPQALILFNGNFVNRQAGHLSDRLIDQAGDNAPNQIHLAYQLALCRKPTSSETSVLTDFLQRETESLLQESLDIKQAKRQSLQQMCRVIFNLNEFAYPD